MRINLFEFNRGSETWRKTNAPNDVVYLAETFEASTIGRGSLEQVQELSKGTLELKLDVYDDLSIALLTGFSESQLTLTIFLQDDATTKTAFKGRLISILPKDNVLVLNFENVFTSLQRPGLRARYQKTCRHLLYGQGCNLDSELFFVEGFVTDLTGLNITVAEAALQPDGYYLGGMVRDANDILGFIVSHVGSVITLQRVMQSLQEDYDANGPGVVSVKIYPGCDRTNTTCLAKFNNLDNFGGFPWIPNRNPLDGDSIL